MIKVTRTLRDFSAAHRLNKGYQGVCQHLHGHNYSVKVSFAAEQLDQYDFVIDFDDIKSLCDSWIKKHWDHVVLISEMDQALLDFVLQDKQRHYVLPGMVNTTAERLAEHLLLIFTNELKNKYENKNAVELMSVEVFETKYSSAVAALPCTSALL